MADLGGSNVPEFIAELLYWRALGRAPTGDELAATSAQLQSGSNADVILGELSAARDPGGSFDGAWVISRAIPDGVTPDEAPGARIGNGKVMAESGNDPESLLRVLVSSPSRGASGTTGNAREVPNATRMTLSDPLEDPVAVTGWTQSLDMYESRFRSEYATDKGAVVADHFALRQFPFAMLSRYTVTPSATGPCRCTT